MKISGATNAMLDQLADVFGQLKNEMFIEPLDLLTGSSIGKHARHIIEFYDCLLKGLASGIIDYDTRERKQILENDVNEAINHIRSIQQTIGIYEGEENKELQLSSSITLKNKILVPTNYHRELVYNIEHCIHHLAIIKIALHYYYPFVQIPPDFGLAFATVKDQQQKKLEKLNSD